jgi:hypothetical protein
MQDYDAILSRLNPHQYHHWENMLSNSSFFDFPTKHDVIGDHVQRAHTLATDLLTGLGAASPRSKRAEAFLADDSDNELPIVFDTGCSLSVTPYEDDFVEDLRRPDVDDMKGLSDSVQVKGMGTVEWNVRDVHGKTGIIRTRAYYVPQASIRLFCPQEYIFEHDHTRAALEREGVYLTIADRTKLLFPWNKGNNLPFMLLDWTENQPEITQGCVCGLVADIHSVNQLLHDSNFNLTNDQKELNLWHQRLGHAGYRWNQYLMRPFKTEIGEPPDSPIINLRYKGAQRCDAPKCPACQLAKQHRRTPRSATTHAKPEREMAIRRNDLEPGECVSIDQYKCTTPGRLPTSYGKEQDSRRYTGGTIFVDHATSFVFINNQISAAAGETIQGKHKFEKFLDSFGVKVKSFRADNHPFNAQLFQDDLEIQQQDITFSGVGAHFQNGVAERAQQTITYWARAMMMHQLLHWPDQFDPKLWPFALEQAAHLWNNMPKQGSIFTPLELVMKLRRPGPSPLTQARVWGCPAYVLDPTLQDGHKLPKWTPRSHLGMYLGSSPIHSPTVGRILNLKTGKITPQYHIMFDELYTTVPGHGTDPVLDTDLWNGMLALDGLQNNLDPTDVDDEGTPFQELYSDFIDPDKREDDFDPIPFPTPPPSVAPSSSGTAVPRGDDADDGRTPTPTTTNSNSRTKPNVTRRPRNPASTSIPTGTRTRSGTQRTRTGRRVRPNPCFAGTYEGYVYHTSVHDHLTHSSRRTPVQQARYEAGGNPHRKVTCETLSDQFLASLKWNLDLNSAQTFPMKQVLLQMQKSFDYDNRTLEDYVPQAYGAKSNDPDTLTWNEAMNGPNKDGFWKAAKKEYDTLVEMEVWDEVDRESWMNVIPGTWAFRIKRYPTGEIKKLKGRWCCRGDRQVKNKDYFSVFSPVCNWNTVRLLLTLTAQLGLANTQVDFVSAFVQADVDKPPNYDLMTEEEKAKTGIFVEMPTGFSKPGKVCKLKKNLYGLKQAPRNFFQHLKTTLEDLGYEQAIDVDPCLFISDKVMILSYVDDCLFFGMRQSDVDAAVDELRKHIILEIEDDVSGFLGVDIKKDEVNGEITLTQTGLINKIIKALDIDDLPPVDTPANEVLGKDEDGDPATCTFNYASVIGALWYLYGHSRPDLGFAVSQAARFTFNPKRSHELALIRIGQYLKKTPDKGMILKPMSTDKLQMDAYVDSDFMGLYGKEKRTDPASAKSRSGHVILLNGCPIIWSSKLQDSIALSTMMAEYYALSSAMREVLPLRSLVQVVAEGCGLDLACQTSFQTTVWEDNNGALTLANLDPGHQTPRSKHYDCRVHWFRSHLSREIKVEKIASELQLADLFTKPLPRETFEKLCEMLMGW